MLQVRLLREYFKISLKPLKPSPTQYYQESCNSMALQECLSTGLNNTVFMAIGSNSRLWKTTVFHHLHGQTGLFTVWINGMQNSGLVNFARNRVYYLRKSVSLIYRKTALKSWNWHQRLPWKNWTRISVWNIPSGKTGPPFLVCFRSFTISNVYKVPP